ncbi:hypothetical protein NM688_g6563 [Phlebia brevispora]|uniref:Uncharacterized protein n=1 Tax=Phlebia brevispora TaxID=194682 RepID=A0ACC1SET3_9APHY|nr:hypothetical protein NM688_g6563 [Phlebia brevispora]
MFTTVLSAALVSTLAIRGVRSEFTIDTPQITQCQPVQITWTAAQGPYNLIVVPSDDPCNGILADLGDHDGLSMTWTANLTAGTEVELSLQDANGDEAWSGPITIAASNDTSCLAASSAAASSTLLSSGAVSASTAATADVTPATT